MISNRWQKTLFITISLILVGLLFVQSTASMVQAGPNLPPRSTPTPSPDNGDGDDGDSDPSGAYIELQAVNSPPGAWAVVQWQDSGGGWHDVPGWRGLLKPGGHERWWVAAKDFGTGPFRWSVTREPGGALLGSSQAFNLPDQANDTLQIVVSVGSQSSG